MLFRTISTDKLYEKTYDNNYHILYIVEHSKTAKYLPTKNNVLVTVL